MDTHKVFSSIPIRKYVGTHDNRRDSLVPSVSGVYVWTRNLAVCKSTERADAKSALQDCVGLIGKPREGDIYPYWSVSLKERRRKFPTAKFDTLADTFSSPQTPFQTWLIQIGNLIQRPLYIGYTTDISQRLEQHLRQDSTLRTKLRNGEVDILDCVFNWAEIPGTNHEAAAVGNAEIEAWLKAAESLLIRLAMPLFNDRQD